MVSWSCIPIRFGRLRSWLFGFSSTTLRIKRAAIHIGITDTKGSTESLILFLIQFCQLVSLSYPRRKYSKGLKDVEQRAQSFSHNCRQTPNRIGKRKTRTGSIREKTTEAAVQKPKEIKGE